MVVKKSKESQKKVDTGTLRFALKNFWTDYVGWGRARRSEYWWVALFYNFLIPMGIGLTFLLFGVVFGLLFDSDTVAEVFGFLGDLSCWVWWSATVVPNFCLCVRRLHDTNRSGWSMLWFFVPCAVLLPAVIITAAMGISMAYGYSDLDEAFALVLLFLLVPALIMFFVGTIRFLLFLCQDGDKKTNRFGAPRK